jgi:hypothetical protein
MSFRRRTYPEVLENLLTSITGGVASESQPFPPPGQTAAPYTLALQQPPAADVVSVWGARDGQPHEFRKGADYVLSEDGRTLVIPEKGAELPDPASLLYVNYVPAAAQPELTDLHVGSVVRTLAETTRPSTAPPSSTPRRATRSTTSSRCSGSSGCAAAVPPATSSSRAAARRPAR